MQKTFQDRILIGIRDAIVHEMKSGMIFTNRKTDFCVELNICPLMKKVPSKNGKTKYISPVCKSCYACDLLNISRTVRSKIERIPDKKLNKVKIFENDIEKLISLSSQTELGDMKKIRFYGLTDFAADNVPFIIAAARHLTVDIISKTLAMKFNEPHLRALINVPNVWISLSFNKIFTKELPRIKRILKETNANNVQLNYCLHTKEENPSDKFYDQFQVIHQRDINKWNAINIGVSKTRICGIYNRDGNILEPTEKGAHCRNCNHCHTNFVESVA